MICGVGRYESAGNLGDWSGKSALSDRPTTDLTAQINNGHFTKSQLLTNNENFDIFLFVQQFYHNAVPQGKYTDDKITCLSCDSDRYSNAGAAECDQCPDGSVPNNTNSGCVECRAVSSRRGMWSILIHVDKIETLIVELTTRQTAELLMSIN